MALKTNSAAINFGTVSGSGGVTITHASLIFNYGQTGQTDAWDNEFLYWTGSLRNSRALVQGDPMEFPAGAFDITLPAGDLQSAGIQRINQAAHDDLGNPTVLLGTGAMGTNGKSNEVSDGGYTRQQAAFTITA